MSVARIHLKPFDAKGASAQELRALHEFSNRMRAEYWPEDPPRRYEDTVRLWRSLPDYVDREAWAVWEGDRIMAMVVVDVWETQDNRHIADVELEVLPERRGRGIATRLLEQAVEVAVRKGRRLMIGGTDTKIPAGEAFMKRLGARVGITIRTNQLDLADLDRPLLHKWQERAQERAGDFELGLWEGPYPEADIDTVVRMKEVMNTAPRDDLEIEDMKWTAEELRQQEKSLVERGIERWTLYARHLPSGEVAGYTEVFWNPNEPEILHQGDTGVFPEFRNRGLGRWLKAAMLERVMRERPTVKRVRTGNAASNDPMLKINYELGFCHYKTWTVWQIEVDRVKAYLAERLDTASVRAP